MTHMVGIHLSFPEPEPANTWGSVLESISASLSKAVNPHGMAIKVTEMTGAPQLDYVDAVA